MATDILQDRIFFAAQKLIETNSVWRCYWLQPSGSECLVFTPVTEAQLTSQTGGTVYRYTVAIDFYTGASAIADRNDLMQQVADVKRILNDNTHYQTGGVSYYFDGFIDSIDYDFDTEDEWKASITWSATHEEVA